MKNESGATWRRPFLLRLNTVFPIGVLACLTLGSIDPAFAENSRLVDRYAAEHTARRPEKQAKSDPLSSGPLFAVVSIADQRISVYDSGGLVARARVSTGMRGHPTPTGVFSIVQKRRWHESNIYSSAPMPFMQRVTWSGIALHAGVVPGHPASHGCIRLPPSFAQRLFGATEIGQRVIIAPSDTAPIEMTHANLPAPKLSPALGVAASSAPEAPDATASVSTPQQNGGAMFEPASLHAPAGPVRLNPLEFARAMKSEANSKAKAASLATRAAMLLIGRKTTELRMAGRKLAGAENAAEDAAGELAAAVRRLAKTDGKEAIAEATEGKSEAEAALVEVQKLREARIAKATEAVNQAQAALIEAQKTAEEARIAKATEAKNEAAAAVTEAQKAEDARIAEATETKNEAEAAVTEAQKVAEEARIAEATEIKNKAAAAVTEAQKAEDARIDEATEAKNEAETALTEVQKAEDARIANATEAKNEAEAALTEARKAEEARIAKATEAKSQAEATLAETQKAVGEARAAKDAKQQELAAARKAAAEAKTAGRAASETLAEATRRLKPLSVFISRKTGRLYVRQNFEPLFDAPVSIRDADREIGTHVYVSTRAAEDGAALYWQAVSVPVAEAIPARRAGKGRGGAQDNAPTTSAAPAPMAEPETAQGALDRVTIPEDTAQRLAELAWVGASVIVSDHGISGETGPTTDFIILTRPRTNAR